MNAHPAIAATDDGPVRLLTLNRPQSLNAFTAESYRELGELLDAAAQDAAVRVVLLLGAGKAFCSGVDVKALAAGSAESFGAAFDGLLEALLTFPKPLLAGVHGAAVGFGMTLLLHCDVVLLADDARLRAPFTFLGTAPEAGSSWLLARAVGEQRAAELLMTSRWVAADEAVAIGLAARVCGRTSLRDQALQTARDIAAHEPDATAAAKRLLRHGRAEAVRAALAREVAAARGLRAQLGRPDG